MSVSHLFYTFFLFYFSCHITSVNPPRRIKRYVTSGGSSVLFSLIVQVEGFFCTV